MGDTNRIARDVSMWAFIFSGDFAWIDTYGSIGHLNQKDPQFIVSNRISTLLSEILNLEHTQTVSRFKVHSQCCCSVSSSLTFIICDSTKPGLFDCKSVGVYIKSINTYVSTIRWADFKLYILFFNQLEGHECSFRTGCVMHPHL